ncbi:MAG: FKBP-type peptidyl-prolyl cis-trans isomerase [Ginsengibacter sp.]
MNRSLFLIAAIAIISAGCKGKDFTKTKTGLEYKTFGGDGTEIKYGNAVKFSVVSYYADSLLSTPYDSLPQFIDVDSSKLPPDYVKIFLQAKKGDSIVTRMLVDSAMKLGQIPPYAQKGKFLGFRMKIWDVIADSAAAVKAKADAVTSMMKADSTIRLKQQEIDDNVLTQRLTKDGVTSTKTTKGVYVEITNPGTGESIDSGKAVTVNYKGMTLDGKIFDQSYDSAGNPTKPYTFVVGQRGSIEGMDDGVRLFKKGGSGRLFIPSGLGYGPRGAGGDIGPNAPLIFDITVTDVSSGENYRKKMMAERQKMMMQQQMQQQMPQQDPQADQPK